MPRPSNADQRRRKLLPLIAEAFCELGYRRATTAEIAERCGVQENILYRLWPDKKAMFVAAIESLFWRRMSKWESVFDESSSKSLAAQLIELTKKNLGEQGLYRIIFTALSETDDPDVRQTLNRLYLWYKERVESIVSSHREIDGDERLLDDDDTAWALIGLVAFMNIAIELDLISSRKRQQLFSRVAFYLLEGALA